MTAPTFSAEFNPKDIARVKKNLQRFQGAELGKRLEKGTMAAARLLVGPVRDAAPVKTGLLKRSVKARSTRPGSGFIRGAKVGPTARYAPPLIRGHVLVAWGNITNEKVTGNPFVDEAVAPRINDAVRVVSAELFKP